MQSTNVRKAVLNNFATSIQLQFEQSVIYTHRYCSFNILCVFSFSYTFASGSPDNIKQWKFPDGNFIQNLSGHNAIINTLAVNSDGVLVSGGKMRNACSYSFPSTPCYEYMAGGPQTKIFTELSFFWDKKPATAYSFVLLQVGSPAFSLLLSCKPKNMFEKNFKTLVGKRFPLLSWLLPRLVAYLQIFFLAL